jgi:hypothetical protein
MPEIASPIKDRLPSDSPIPAGTQKAFHAVVHLVIPSIDPYGLAIADSEAAMAYVTETLCDKFLDWGYVVAIDPETGEAIEYDAPDRLQTPIPVTVCSPYVEDSFFNYDPDE